MDPQKTTTIHGTPRKAACRRLVLDGFLLLPVAVDSIMSTATSHDNASPKPPSHRNTLDGHPLRAWCVAAFPDNERVVSASDDDTVVVWKFRTKEKERSWSHKGATTVAVSHDGNKVVSGGRDCSLKLWDAMSGQPLAGPWKVHEQRVWSVSWSPNGNRIASCSADSILIIWNAHSGEPIFKPLPTEQNEVYAVAYSPNGEKVATGGQDFTIKIWDAHTGDLQATLRGHAMSVSSVAWTKDGSNVISGSVDGIVRIWDIIKEKGVCHEIQAHSHGVNYIAVSGHVFATATPDHAYLWSLKTRQRVCGPFELSKSDEANCVALSDDENTISACTEKGRVYTWNIGKITSAIQKGDAEDFSDIGDIDVTGSPDHDDFLPNDFFGDTRSHAFQESRPSRSRNRVKRRVIFQRLVAPLRVGIPRDTVPRETVPRATFTSRLRLLLNETNENYNRRPATFRTNENAAGRRSQLVTTTECGPVSQPSSPTTPRERLTWARLWAAVRRLLIFHRHG